MIVAQINTGMIGNNTIYDKFISGFHITPVVQNLPYWIMNTNKITDSVLIKGADANKDNKISALDYITIKNIIMGGA